MALACNPVCIPDQDLRMTQSGFPEQEGFDTESTHLEIE